MMLLGVCMFLKSLRQLQICKSRQKVSLPEDKVKNTLSNKIAMENWRKKKQHKGPGYFQQNRKPEKEKKKKSLEEWERLSVIPWGGNYVLPTAVIYNYTILVP